MANAGDFGLVTLTGHRREYANMFAYAARAHVVVVRSLMWIRVVAYAIQRMRLWWKFGAYIIMHTE